MHYTAGVRMLWDAMRCLLRLLGVTCEKLETSGWWQSGHWLGKVRKLFNRVGSAQPPQGKKANRWVKLYLQMAQLRSAHA